MTHGSLFSGIGGFDLAAEWMGWENKFHCEINPFGRRILNYYWPNATSYEDIKTTDFSIWRGLIDVLSGGFPCQPYSVAGLRKGKEDERHLWPEMLRAIREIQPRYVVGENVRGLTNWNGGMVFDEVQSDLEVAGYEVLPFLLPAAGVNAPHRRDRIFFVAHAVSDGYEREYDDRENRCTSETREREEQGSNRKRLRTNFWGTYAERNASDANFIGLEGSEKETTWQIAANRNDWSQFPTQPPVCSGDDGLSSRLDGITFSKWRNESIKGYGNAVVLQVVHEIFKIIEQLS